MYFTYDSLLLLLFFFFFFNDTATTEIYTLSLHDALPICRSRPRHPSLAVYDTQRRFGYSLRQPATLSLVEGRSEEHTSELQSPCNLVCRLLLEKKKKKRRQRPPHKNPKLATDYAPHALEY